MENLTKKHEEIINLIRSHSPFDKDETLRIINKFFKSIPPPVKILTENHQFHIKKVLEIGCSYGQTFLYWAEDSEGIDIQPQMIKFLQSLGKKIHNLNAEEEFSNFSSESFDAVYSSNLIEHLLSPHLFLAKIHSLLKPSGLLALEYPLVPPLPFRWIWKTLNKAGWLAAEHINFFTLETSRLMLERAGFKVIKCYGFLKLNSYPFKPILSKLGLWCGEHTLCVCQKVNNFKYNPKRLAVFDPDWAPELKYFR